MALLVAALLPLGAQAGTTGVPAAEVVRREGQPSVIWFDADGREIWEYGANPYRFTGLRFIFNDEGRLIDQEQTRQEPDIQRIGVGTTTRRQVREILGEPLRLYAIRGDIHWEWPVFWLARIPHRLVVQFDDRGVVKDVGKYRLTIRGSGIAN
jgi:hypothetical protein